MNSSPLTRLYFAAIAGFALSLSSIGFTNKIYWVPLWDEAGYLATGLSSDVSVNNFGLIGLVYGFLYIFITDPALLSVSGQVLIFCLGMAAASIALYLGTRNFSLTIIMTSCVLIAEYGLSVNISPKSGIFFFSVFLCMFALLTVSSNSETMSESRIDRGVVRLVPLLTAHLIFFFCSFARPESITAWLVFCIVNILGFVYLLKKISNYSAALCLAMVALALTSIFYFYSVIGDRSWVAFGQHYSLGLQDRGLLPNGESPWFDWPDIVARDFGDASTILQALSNNPTALLSHVFANVFRLFPLVLFRVPVSDFLILASAVHLYRNKTKLASFDSIWWILLSMPICILVPFLASSILIYPRDHYLPVFCLSAFSLFLYVLNSIPIKTYTPPSSLISFNIILLCSIILYNYNSSNNRDPYLDEIFELRGFITRTNAKHYIYPDGGGSVYLRPAGRELFEFSFDSFKSSAFESECIIIRDLFFDKIPQIIELNVGFSHVFETLKTKVYCRDVP